ncbi:hypothetical protein FO519_006054 [Halicephalobus sp. NKZ332]|nr:hypothetical protein FO519_006054 [Halicephalobus sp. NKZ332]
MTGIRTSNPLMKKEEAVGIPKKNSRDLSYESAVYHLNSLQSNATTLRNVRERRNYAPEENVAETQYLLDILGIKSSQIDNLKIIYISGTKGKGSTCAFSESILRGLGFRTGFYSSPHLVHVRERIRINSNPISEESFAQNFFEVYQVLKKNADSGRLMPAYFKFLTLMAFHVFIKEKVDVAVIEVGIGGEYDCTNVISNPVVCGITSLDYDHTSILGNTLPEIAWHKAGIMKPGSLAVSVDQPKEALEVIENRAKEKNSGFFKTPSIDEYSFPGGNLENRLPGHHQATNLSLALQLVKIWLEKTGNLKSFPSLPSVSSAEQSSILPGFTVPDEFVQGLNTCSWKGRGQTVKRGKYTYFLDGAHTPKSISYCADWYKSKHEKSQENPFQILLFTCTADRNPSTLLPSLKSCGFDLVLFSATRLLPSVDKHLDSANLNTSEVEQKEKCELSKKVWADLTGKDAGEIFNCVSDAMQRINEVQSENPIHILVTGSLHLVGGVLGFVFGVKMIDGENEGNDSKMADVVKTVLLIKNWVTGKADKDTNVTRLEDDFVMLGFFNSLQQANHSSLEFSESPIDFRTRKYNLEKYHSFYRNKTTFVKFSNLTKKYSLSFYWSALTLTTLGENPPPNNSFQSLFEIVDTLIGLIIIAVIVGDVGAMVTSMNMMRSQFEEKLDGCKTYMKFRSVNIVLQKKIIQWFEYGWKAGSAKIDESTIMECLPPRLRGQLAVHIHMDTLRKVLLFQDCEPGLLYELVLKLQLQIFSPGDVVCRKGDIGKELYIIKKGSLQVVSEDLKTVFVTLSEGKVFGELSVLNIKGNKNGNRRTATILSVGFSDCYVLTKSDLWEVLREYPDAKRSLMEKGKFILRKDNLLVEKDAVEEDTVEDSDLDESPNLEQRLAKIARDVEKSRNQLKKAGFDFAVSSLYEIS